jgi:hypothetical protein
MKDKKMGRIKEYLERQGYNFKERAYIHTGMIAGIVAPTIAARYTLLGGVKTNGAIEELITWGAALAVNAIPIASSPYIPLGALTTVVGGSFGTFAANNSKRKRFKKENQLEKKFKHI